MPGGAYRFVVRPTDVAHGHPVLVFDHADRLHLPLTIFAKVARAHVSRSTTFTYLHALLPFFAFLDEAARLGHPEWRWDTAPGAVRTALDAYLIAQHRCLVRTHRAGFQLVARTAETPSTLRVFLSAAKLFYRVMQAQGTYAFANPLQDALRTAVGRAAEAPEADDAWPPMPAGRLPS
jgi:hypothetical protein